jgi:hypothetical protein
MMLDYSVRLPGLSSQAPGLPGPLLRDLLDAVDRSARGVVRLRFEGRSTARGGAPTWVNAAACFSVVGFTTGVPGVLMRVPTLGSAIPERLRQYQLFDQVDAGASALTLLGDSLADALSGNADSDLYDEGLLGSFEEFRRVFRQGVEAVEIRNGRPASPAVTITQDGVRVIRRLQRATPRPQRVRVAGKVDAIRHSDRAFTLVLESGIAIRGVLADGQPEELTPFWGRIAVVSGTAHFRPSGALHRIDAEHLSPGSDRDLELWSAVPRPLSVPLDTRALHRVQGPRTGLNALIGEWPGDESEETILALIEELS